ncbi:1-deoxy-D-xylulose-5-phosphate synthase [Alicyclobacillus sp. SO9]|uniref:1-deoxy-D-xylulose-5-phosphate synthase n=1 Tax=Alicyclobacillus sp. SO9 TaxID=2665646 RepID=UPI0018E83929|nr:1-deoxy-D-xylulose-5-phosphate synthase [Alicyclobacillus sp. SO9]QQE76966.1 1-deoxy-D-xylulose-5-phosphate synthase [Alicyclobacillus sp. SO9]
MSQTILENINQPADLKHLSEEELVVLTNEIREFLVNSVSQTGGHFGANLGVVELTVALHRIYNSPTDKIIWDVGHQSYVHKILTGRKHRFPTLRKFKGMAGFPRRHESEHDQFGAGHASTSISAGLGMAVARDLNHDNYSVVSVIGDGALTGGMAMEALNHAGHVGTDFTVILNDNEMSIAQNVGAVSRYLTRLRTDPTYSKAKAEIEQLLRRVPAIGSRLSKTLEWTKDSLRQMILPGQLFEAFGFKYLGPVDGHNLLQVMRVIEDAKQIKGPVLIHMITSKGKGYGDAEAAPDKFHAWPSSKKKTVPSYTSIFADTITELAQRDKDIVAVTPAMVPGSGLTKFGEEFPDRLYDVGIAEQHAATFCGGLAAAGKKPVLAIYSTFMQRAYDQVIHDICIQNLPVVIAVDRAGLVGPDGETHQGAFDISYLRAIPNITLMAPKDENELRHMLYTAFDLEGPVAVRYPRTDGLGVNLDEEYTLLPEGQGEVLRQGHDVTVLALGTMVSEALQAAEVLSKHHSVSASVVNMRFVKPIDKDLICRFAKSGSPMVTVEEAALAGGMGSAVLEVLAENNLQVPVRRIGLPDKFIEHGSRPELLKDVGLCAEGITTQVLEFLSNSMQSRIQAWS